MDPDRLTSLSALIVEFQRRMALKKSLHTRSHEGLSCPRPSWITRVCALSRCRKVKSRCRAMAGRPISPQPWRMRPVPPPMLRETGAPIAYLKLLGGHSNRELGGGPHVSEQTAFDQQTWGRVQTGGAAVPQGVRGLRSSAISGGAFAFDGPQCGPRPSPRAELGGRSRQFAPRRRPRAKQFASPGEIRNRRTALLTWHEACPQRAAASLARSVSAFPATLTCPRVVG